MLPYASWPLFQGFIPESKIALAGVQIGVEEYAFSNFIPYSANLSKFVVSIASYP